MNKLTVPTNGNKRPAIGMPMTLRKLVLLDRARQALGGAANLGLALGICRRAANHKLSGDRSISDADILHVVTALEEHAAKAMRLAADMRELTKSAALPV